MLLALGLLSTTAQAVYLPEQMIPRPIFTAPAPGEMRDEIDLVNLKPGQNILSLTLENSNKVNESNEQNNHFQIVANVSGHCGPSSMPPQRAVSPTLPPVVLQVPGNQTPQQAPLVPGPRRLNPPER